MAPSAPIQRSNSVANFSEGVRTLLMLGKASPNSTSVLETKIKRQVLIFLICFS